MARAIGTGERVARSNTPAARAMDRHNNTLAAGLGATARSTEDVVERVRGAMEHAMASHGGSGHQNTPAWRASRHWSEGGSLADWSPAMWPDPATSPHFDAYRSAIAGSGRPERNSTGGGPVQVSPHVRDGPHVSGHTRSTPAR